ncbi:MAG: threonine-phosphate decarboxylase CobD [Nitrospirae bacterium]|nr:threonine-phosphate decarboxylase CobD [Nitrospirota bacterium]
MQNTETEIDTMINAEVIARKTIRTHGGNIYEAARRYGYAESKILDFSSNMNPLGPSSAAKRAAKKAISSIGRYPDPDLLELRTAIARYFGIKSGHVICGNGSNALIHLIPRVFRPKKVLIPFPTFTEYAVAVEDAGGEVVPFSLLEREGFRVDPLEMSFALKDVDMAFLCNPNNPTGPIVPKAEMLEIARFALQHGVRLVVDEAFMDFDFMDSDSIIKEAVESSHLICLRTFTAFFGMPGLQIGYAVSDEKTIAVLRDRQEPWTVSIPSEQAAIAALGDWPYIKKTRRLIEKERGRLLSALRILPGVETFPCAANFILIKITSLDVPTFINKLGERGILVRDCSSFPGLDGRYIRIAVRTWWDNRRLIKAFRELLVR